ncbi:hypothetical protein KIPB_013834, partial [Kipferlia bialata]|eukprot:g13834.t1
MVNSVTTPCRSRCRDTAPLDDGDGDFCLDPSPPAPSPATLSHSLSAYAVKAQRVQRRVGKATGPIIRPKAKTKGTARAGKRAKAQEKTKS